MSEYGEKSAYSTEGTDAAASGAPRGGELVKADAVIIGAGYAGGTVARELAARGLKPVLLEARSRVGGRIFTGTFAGQDDVELGGGWLGPQQQLIHAELRRYHIETYEDTAAEHVVLHGGDGGQTLSPGEAEKKLLPLWDRFFEGSDKYFERPHDPLYRKDLLASVDPLSLKDRLDRIGLSPSERALLEGEISVYAGGDSSLGGLTSMAQWVQLAGGDYSEYLKTMTLRPKGGMIATLKAMLSEAQADLHLSTPVTKVTEEGGLVTVETDKGQRFVAPVVVVATPVNVWRSIDFRPGLPAAHTRATTEGVGVPYVAKTWLLVKGEVPAVQGQAGPDAVFPMLIPQQQTPEGRLMVAFGGTGLDPRNAAQVQEAVRSYIPGAEVLRHRAMLWAEQPYSSGGWGLRRPNQLLDLYPQIDEPHGRIVFAGADIAEGWHGAFIEGAVETGLRAARQAAELA
ncbi:flavin monoamine oxidase family protein [Streptomyces catenulae]|uniref:FAD-dependent oxidoreductase n=1 Tax=Streptomyces catenulae TaxID=66875 RepID=A0ABV2Z1W2_9ACTN|nr:NAD(P)/FAD-dependent oxidoreductase [Streptomyces catenulae]